MHLNINGVIIAVVVAPECVQRSRNQVYTARTDTYIRASCRHVYVFRNLSTIWRLPSYSRQPVVNAANRLLKVNVARHARRSSVRQGLARGPPAAVYALAKNDQVYTLKRCVFEVLQYRLRDEFEFDWTAHDKAAAAAAAVCCQSRDLLRTCWRQPPAELRNVWLTTSQLSARHSLALRYDGLPPRRMTDYFTVECHNVHRR